MEKDTKDKQTEINPLLFKLVIPIALSIVGVIISTLRKSRTRRKPSEEQMDYPESMTRYEYDDEEESEEVEEDEEEMPVAGVHLLESTREISIQHCHEGSNSEEHIEGVKSLVASIEERQSALEAQFYDYCDTKEQESTFQKLQIMCAGLKLESLESQNQRFEDTISKRSGAIEQVDQLREEVKSLRRNNKKLARANSQYSRRMQMMSDEFHLVMKDIKRVADQLHTEIKGIEHELEIRSSKIENKTVFEHIRQLQDQWSADMEELIYVGWINASLRREFLIIDQEEEEAKSEVELGGNVVMEFLEDENVKNCGVEFYNAECPSTSVDIEDMCTDIKAKKHGRGSKKPRLVQKLKGWATGKRKCKRACESWPCANS